MQFIIGSEQPLTVNEHLLTNQDNIRYKITTLQPFSHILMQWQAPHWQNTSILQIRILPVSAQKTTLAIHQEKLLDEKQRTEMKSIWQEKIDGIEKYFCL